MIRLRHLNGTSEGFRGLDKVISIECPCLNPGGFKRETRKETCASTDFLFHVV